MRRTLTSRAAAVYRTAHGGDAAGFVDGGADNGEVEAVLAADIAVEDIADMQADIDVATGSPRPCASRADDRRWRRSRFGAHRRYASLPRLRAGEDRQRAVADQFQHIAAGLLDRQDNGFGIVVEQRNEMVRVDGFRQARVAGHVGEPKHGVDLVDLSAGNAAAQHALSGIAPEIGFDQGLGDAGQRGGLDRQAEDRCQPAQRVDRVIAEAAGPAVVQRAAKLSISPMTASGAKRWTMAR